LARAKALEDKYTRAVADQRDKVLKLRNVQGEGGKLMLELQSAEAVYKRALDGYDQIMFASVGNYTNVSVVSPATPPVKASKPNKLKLLIVGMIAGLGIGMAVPFLYEIFLNRRVRCREDVERSFGVPVLMQFETIDSAPEPA
jgi:succinoglycan biosynthesis transport protein ExoP